MLVSLLIVVAIAFGALAGTIAGGWSPRLGLDLAGGFSVVYKPAHNISQTDLNEAVTILTNRVNGLGVNGATVSTQGNEIDVQVPGVKNANQVLATIGQTAQMYLRPALCLAPPYSPKRGTAPPPSSALPTSCPSQYQLVTANASGSASSGQGINYNNVSADPSLAEFRSTAPSHDTYGKTALLPQLGQPHGARYLLGPAQLTGHIIKSAYAQQNQLGQWVVNFSLTSSGSTQWDSMAQRYFHEIIAFEIDGVVQSAPITLPQSASFSSFGGNVQISGAFTQQSANSLAVALNYGALPVRLDKLTTETVSPTLGKSSLDAGLAAGIAGLILVLLYTIVYYRLLGIVVVSGLALTAALLWAIISALGHTSFAPSFDLAGVTGVIVSIGITVDSYIVYFERLKDETRAGRTVRTSVDRGFKSAFRTVLAADFVSLLAAVLLYWLAVGDVKGFAFFLGLSTLLDVFVTYFFTRPMVSLVGRSDRLTEAKRIGVSRGLAVGLRTEP